MEPPAYIQKYLLQFTKAMYCLDIYGFEVLTLTKLNWNYWKSFTMKFSDPYNQYSKRTAIHAIFLLSVVLPVEGENLQKEADSLTRSSVI